MQGHSYRRQLQGCTLPCDCDAGGGTPGSSSTLAIGMLVVLSRISPSLILFSHLQNKKGGLGL